MSSNVTEERRVEYFIQLPIQQAIEVRDEIETSAWEIANQEQDVKEILEEADFDIQSGKTAIDPYTVITVIITYTLIKAADKTIDKTMDKLYDETTDKVWKIWTTKILPGLKQKFGENVLEKKEKNENDK